MKEVSKINHISRLQQLLFFCIEQNMNFLELVFKNKNLENKFCQMLTLQLVFYSAGRQ